MSVPVPSDRWTYGTRARVRLAIAVGAALAVYGAARAAHLQTARLLSWDVGGMVYLALAAQMMRRSTLESIRADARRGGSGTAAVLFLTLLAVVACLGAIVVQLAGVKDLPLALKGSRLILAFLTIVTSWTLVHVAFALHYAHDFYAELERTGRPPLALPGAESPAYIDFLYFSFVIGVASQTADISTASTPMRKLVLLHGLVSFFFNTTLLALTINIAAGLI